MVSDTAGSLTANIARRLLAVQGPSPRGNLGRSAGPCRCSTLRSWVLVACLLFCPPLLFGTLMDKTRNDRPPTILIDGAFGQDGQIIVAELCKSKKVDVHVLTHHRPPPKLPNAWDSTQVKISYWDSKSFVDIGEIIQKLVPSAYINLAAHHHSALDMAKEADQGRLYGENYCRSA